MKHVDYLGPRIGRIGAPELTALLVIYTVSDVFLSYPARLVSEGATGGWLIPIGSGLIVLGVWLAMERMMRRAGIEHVFGELTGIAPFPIVSVVLMLLSLALLFQTALTMREFTEAVVATVLPNTPPPVVTFTFLLVALYFSSKGIEAISRAALLFFYFFIVGLVFLLVLPLNWFHGEQLLPFWGNGIHGLWSYAIANTSAYYQILILLIISPAIYEPSLRKKTGIFSIGISLLLISVFLVVLLGTFTVPITEQMTFPMYQLSRVIYISRFIQRLEAGFVFLWTAAAVIKLGFGLWMTAYLFSLANRMPIYRPLIFVFALLLYILSFLPPDLPTVLKIAGGFFETYGGLWTVVIPFLLVTILYYQKHYDGLRHQRTGGRESAHR